MADVQKAGPGPLQTMKTLIQKYSPDIQRLIPKHVDAEQIVMIAQAALTRNPDLLKCDPRTVLAGIIQCSVMGLQLHTALHHASLVPFYNKNAQIFEAVLIIEYPGLIELVMRGGGTSFVEAQAVHENDVLEVEYGSDARLVHRPELRAPRGRLIGAYAYAKFKDGQTKFHYMTAEDIEERRAASKAKDAGPWKSWEAEMYLKTPLRHLCKQLRKTTELAVALEHESRFDQGVTGLVEGDKGLSMDFLSMSVEAKTLDKTEDLKKRITDKSAKQTTGKQQPHAAATTTSAAPSSPSATPQDGRRESPGGEAAAGSPPAAAVLTPEGERAADEIAAQQEQLMAEWDKEAQAATQMQSPVLFPESPAPAAAATPEPPKSRAQRDPLDKFIEQSEVLDMLREIKSRSISDVELRAKLDAMTPKVMLLRNLTVRQYREMMDWIQTK
jgi:recombination protein RecT